MEFEIALQLQSDDVLRLLKQFSNYFHSFKDQDYLSQYSIKLSTYARFIVVKDNDDIIAFISYYLNDESQTIFIPLVAVDSSYQRVGIGGRLFDSLEQAHHGYKRIRLEVYKTNDKGIAFYNKHGFFVESDLKDKLLMERTIS